MLPLRRCLWCQANLLQSAQLKRQNYNIQIRHQSSKQIDVAKLLSKPTWSVESLLPTPEQLEAANEVTPEQLHHLLRLSALPLPKDAVEETELIKALHTQLHFVKQIQSVDTIGVEPLVAIRDETDKAKAQNAIGMKDPAIREALKNEELKGRNKRPRRNREVLVNTKDAEDWEVLATAKKTEGRFFVVDSSK